MASLSSSLKPGFNLSSATEEDLPSLISIHKRAFHPTKALQKKAIPDTPIIMDWWLDSFKKAILDPKSEVFVVRDSNKENTVTAAIRMKWFDGNEDGSGFWSSDALTTDHDVDICMSFIEPMTVRRVKLLYGRPHFHWANSEKVIELFGTDHSYQGTGAGTALLSHCCRLADEKAVPIFVEANTGAKGFYQRFGFIVEDEIVLASFDYGECFLVRYASR